MIQIFASRSSIVLLVFVITLAASQEGNNSATKVPNYSPVELAELDKQYMDHFGDDVTYNKTGNRTTHWSTVRIFDVLNQEMLTQMCKEARLITHPPSEGDSTALPEIVASSKLAFYDLFLGPERKKRLRIDVIECKLDEPNSSFFLTKGRCGKSVYFVEPTRAVKRFGREILADFTLVPKFKSDVDLQTDFEKLSMRLWKTIETYIFKK